MCVWRGWAWGWGQRGRLPGAASRSCQVQVHSLARCRHFSSSPYPAAVSPTSAAIIGAAPQVKRSSDGRLNPLCHAPFPPPPTTNCLTLPLLHTVPISSLQTLRLLCKDAAQVFYKIHTQEIFHKRGWGEGEALE